MARPPVSEQVQVNFRMPVDLRNRIRTAAENRNRSMSAEIVAALEEKYPAPVKNTSEFLLDAVRRFESQGTIPEIPADVFNQLVVLLDKIERRK